MSPIIVQRIEGAAWLVLAVVVFAMSDLSWWWLVLLLLVPDLSMLGYLAGATAGALFYNLGHTLVWPVALLAWGSPPTSRGCWGSAPFGWPISAWTGPSATG